MVNSPLRRNDDSANSIIQYTRAGAKLRKQTTQQKCGISERLSAKRVVDVINLNMIFAKVRMKINNTFGNSVEVYRQRSKP